MIEFCQAGNLKAILENDSLPAALKPYISRIQALYKPAPSPTKQSISKLLPINRDVLDLLVTFLNEINDQYFKWTLPEKWCLLSRIEAKGFAPVTAQAIFHHRIKHQGVTFSTFSTNQDTSIIMFKASKSSTNFGKITSIFEHRRTLKSLQEIVDTWVCVEMFPCLPKTADTFSRLNFPDVQAHVRIWNPTKLTLIKLDQIVCHCGWMVYDGMKISPRCKSPTIGLISINR